MSYLRVFEGLSTVELFFAGTIFLCALLYLHFFFTYSWNKQQLKLLDKKDDYNLIGFGFWGMLVCIFTLAPLFIDKDSHAFTINVICLLISVVSAKYFYFKSLRKLLDLPKFDHFYKKMVIVYIAIASFLFFRSFELGGDTLFDLSKVASSNSDLRNLMLPYGLKNFVKMLFLPNFLFCFIAYIYLIVKSYKRKEYFITFGVSFTLGAVIFSNSYHLFQFKYWMPINVVADIFELFRLNVAQKAKINTSIEQNKEELQKLSLEHDVFKHDLGNKFFSSQMNLEWANILLNKDEVETEEVKQSVMRAMEAQKLASAFFKNSDEVIDIDLVDFFERISDFIGIKVIFSSTSKKRIRFNAVDFHNIFINLVKNSKEATLNHSEAWVKVFFDECSEGKFYHFKVIDCGEFEQIKDKDKLFNLGTSSKSNSSVKSGIGLYSVKEIVQKYNGQLELEPFEENTCFSFSLSSVT